MMIDDIMPGMVVLYKKKCHMWMKEIASFR